MAETEASFQHCATVTRRASSSFYLASRFFEPEVRRDLYAVYAFCRIADDIADTPGLAKQDRINELGILEHTLKTERYEADDLLWPAFFDAIGRHEIPKKYFRELLEGMMHDIEGKSIKSLHDLERYCYLVAGTVGGMCAYLVTKPDPDVIEAAIGLGVAMQITNILRDVSADAKIGRVYLPADMMRRYGVKPANIQAGRATTEAADLMRELADIAQAKYSKAELVIEQKLPAKNRRAIKIALRLYRGILFRIEQRNFNVYNTRVRLNFIEKVLLVTKTR